MKPNQEQKSVTPALFVGHGNPMNAVEENRFAASLYRLGQTIEKPRAIVAISAHWVSNGTAIGIHDSKKLMYDMYGFPKELYEVTYEPPCADFLLSDIKEIIPNATTQERNIDHGIWSVLVHLFPEADIPVIVISLDSRLTLKEHFQRGEALRKLRQKGVMILASGNVTHNLREAVLYNKDAKEDAWAQEFDRFVKDAVQERDATALIEFDKEPTASLAHPSIEHFIPILYAVGASYENERPEFFYEAIEHGNLSMRSWIYM